MNLENFDPRQKPTPTNDDKKILKNLEKSAKDVTKDMENFRFYAAGEKIYHYFWHTFADKIIEGAKPRLKSENQKDRLNAQYLLLETLKTNLKLLHPFMPFITEEIYQKLPILDKKLLIIEEWPI
jgi:valyl-tRNA synthetase